MASVAGDTKEKVNICENKISRNDVMRINKEDFLEHDH